MADMSSIEQRLNDDLTASMRAGDKARTSTLRMVLSAVRAASVAGDTAVVLDDAAVVQVLRS
ncbi:MAG: GatB/YqeY domain-containing protein, partial [Ilumatobacteraceae bacterium]